MALERQGDFDAALTSYRLALRDRPNDTKILQNMAIAFTKTNRPEEAIRCYRSALEHRARLVRRALRPRVSAAQARRSARRRKASRGVPREAAVRPGSRALGPPREETLETLRAGETDLRRVRAIAWDKSSRSSVKRAASARPRRRSTSRPRSLAAATRLCSSTPIRRARCASGSGSAPADDAHRSLRLSRRHARDARSRAHDEPALAARRVRRAA